MAGVEVDLHAVSIALQRPFSVSGAACCGGECWKNGFVLPCLSVFHFAPRDSNSMFILAKVNCMRIAELGAS